MNIKLEKKMFDKWITIQNIDINLAQVIDVTPKDISETEFKLCLYHNHGDLNSFMYNTKEERDRIHEEIRKITKPVEIS